MSYLHEFNKIYSKDKIKNIKLGHSSQKICSIFSHKINKFNRFLFIQLQNYKVLYIQLLNYINKISKKNIQTDNFGMMKPSINNQKRLINNDKPIKYKQFIQNLHNSSCSSINNDQSILSQRSFRQSNSNNINSKSSLIKSNQVLNQRNNQQNRQSQQRTYREEDINKNHKVKNQSFTVHQIKQKRLDKLYTFCDIKNTQKSIQNTASQNQRHQQKKQNVIKKQKTLQRNQQSISQKKICYFKSQKQRNENKNNKYKFDDKQNINTSNSIRKHSGFQGTVLNTETQSHDYSSKKKNINFVINNTKQVQSVKKVLKLSDKNYMKKSLNNQQKQLLKPEQSDIKSRFSQQSSNKKIISLNINHVKPNIQNKIKLKLSLDRNNQSQTQSLVNSNNKNKQKISFLKQNNQLIKNNININQISNNNININQRSNNNININQRSKYANLDRQNYDLNCSLQKMYSLDQSKVLSPNSTFRNLLISSNDVKQFSGFFTRQRQQNEQQHIRLYSIIDQYKKNQIKLKKQISQLNLKLSQNKSKSINADTTKQIQITREQNNKLKGSYKQMQKHYTSLLHQKEIIQQRYNSLQKQNQDLKQCFAYNKQKLFEMQQKISHQQQQIYDLQVSRNQTLPDIQGLTQMIKQKLQKYQHQIGVLLWENQKLNQIKDKLQTYNQTLKDEIDQKDQKITHLEQTIKYHQSYIKSSQDKSVKLQDLRGKLALANLHNEFLTKQILNSKNDLMLKNDLTLKNEKYKNNPSQQYKIKQANKPEINNKFRTITTRQSSICNIQQDTIRRQKQDTRQ